MLIGRVDCADAVTLLSAKHEKASAAIGKRIYLFSKLGCRYTGQTAAGFPQATIAGACQ
jgi:hypothetical protein